MFVQKMTIVMIVMIIGCAQTYPKTNDPNNDVAVFNNANAIKDTKFKETRYCNGDERSAAVVTAFKRIHPCPETGLSTGACPGWAVDHVIPLAVGGCDAVSNLQWLPNEIKSCAGTVCKDRWERKIYERVIVTD